MAEIKNRTWGDIVKTKGSKWTNLGYPVPIDILNQADVWLSAILTFVQEATFSEVDRGINFCDTLQGDKKKKKLVEVSQHKDIKDRTRQKVKYIYMKIN